MFFNVEKSVSAHFGSASMNCSTAGTKNAWVIPNTGIRSRINSRATSLSITEEAPK